MHYRNIVQQRHVFSLYVSQIIDRFRVLPKATISALHALDSGSPADHVGYSVAYRVDVAAPSADHVALLDMHLIMSSLRDSQAPADFPPSIHGAMLSTARR